MLTVKQLQDAGWVQVYAYTYGKPKPGEQSPYGFKIFTCQHTGITVTHDRKLGASRMLIYYTVNGRKTDSPTQAVRWYNEQEKHKQGGRTAPGSVQSIKAQGDARRVRRRGNVRAGLET